MRPPSLHRQEPRGSVFDPPLSRLRRVYNATDPIENQTTFVNSRQTSRGESGGGDASCRSVPASTVHRPPVTSTCSVSSLIRHIKLHNVCTRLLESISKWVIATWEMSHKSPSSELDIVSVIENSVTAVSGFCETAEFYAK